MARNAAEALGRVLSTVGYLRVTVGEADRDPWLACTRLVSDADHLLEVVRSTASSRGTDRDHVAMSLFSQAYAFRIASLAIGAWLLDDAVLDLDPARMSVVLGRGRPNAVHLHELRSIPTDDPLGTLHEVLVDGHLAPFIANARAGCRIGEALLWANAGAACASAFGAFMAPLPERRAEIRDRFGSFLAIARPELKASGRIVPLGPVWSWDRSACCLWYKTESGSRCEDCSLWTAAERQARYDRMLAELER